MMNDSSVKLSDFGLSSFLDGPSDDVSVKLPVRWCAIEVINSQPYTTKSDVWSFGILSYEIFSYGAIPYSKLTEMEVIDYLKAGKRLEKLEKISDDIFELLLTCWDKNPSRRPLFEDISKYFSNLIKINTIDEGYLSFVKSD